MLARFLDPHKAELEKHYVFVKTDISRDEGIDVLRERYKEGKEAGVPWFAILDADGQALINSNAPKVDPRHGTANMGFPTLPHEIDHFIKMLETTGTFSEEKLAELRAALGKKE